MKKKLKVLHVIPSVSLLHGGPTHVALSIVKALRTNDIDAEILTTNDDGAGLLDVPLNRCVDYQGVPIWFVPRFSPPLKEFIFSPAVTLWLRQNIHRYSILDNHYLFSYLPTCAAFIARCQHIPYTVRTMGQLSPWALGQSKLKKQIYSTLFERNTLTNAAAVHCTTTREAIDVRQFGITTPTATIPLGVDIPQPIPDASFKLRQLYGVPKNRFIILFLSRIHYKKRPELLLETIYFLSQRGKDIHLFLAGSGETNYIDDLKCMVQKFQLQERVTFTGFAQGLDKDILLQGSDLFVLPSYSENFGVAVAEALASGLAVITTPGVQISSEILAARAGLVVDGQHHDLAQAIEQVICDANLRQELSLNGKNLAHQRYSWQTISQHLSEVYTSIIERQKLPFDIDF